MLKDKTIIAQKVKQNNLEFFAGVFTINQILKFTRYTERLIVGYDEENRPIYNKEIQRKAEPSRVEKIADFLINDPDALFPTNLVVAIPSSVINRIVATSDRIVKIELNDKVFDEIKKHSGDVFLTIIDGQHRIKGIERAIELLQSELQNLNKILEKTQKIELVKEFDRLSKKLQNLLSIELMVGFFIDPTLEFQAMVFSTINRTQKTVPQSLVYSLFGLTESDSPQKSALEIVLALNSFEKSPFYDRIKLHGGEYGKNQSPPLTQAMMVRSIIDLICANAREAENDRFRERKELKKGINRDLPFRKYYAEDRDNFITDILFSFFTAVRNTFKKNGKQLWNFAETTKPQNVLQTTVGYAALLEILIDILEGLSETEKDKIEVYEGFLRKAAKLNFEDELRYPFTSKTRKVFYYDLSLAIWPPKDGNDERLKKLSNATAS